MQIKRKTAAVKQLLQTDSQFQSLIGIKDPKFISGNRVDS
jgi:hypothetical protein